MKSAVKKSVLRLLLPALLLTTPACRREARNQNPDTSPPLSAPSASTVPASAVSGSPAPTTVSTADHAEVFRRAFWRHPVSADRILHAERRVSAADDSWQWFIQLHPSPGLLAALRDPDTFGLLRLPPATAPRPWPTSPGPPPPAWFPTPATLAGSAADFEILQAPSTGLTVLYRTSDNVLFATDTGTGFAPPAR